MKLLWITNQGDCKYYWRIIAGHSAILYYSNPRSSYREPSPVAGSVIVSLEWAKKFAKKLKGEK